MKVTIDSSEPLADALRVIGALYNVSLTPVDGRPAVSSSTMAKAPQRSEAMGNGARSRTDRKAKQPATVGRRTRSTRKTPTASSSDIRAWALANGQAVSARGTLPAAVKAAYAAAHTG